MLRKRTRSILKDQHNTGHMEISDTNYESYSQSHALGNNSKSASIFNAPLQFVGMGPKGLLDCDSVRSPTSPLDFTFLSNLSNPFRTLRSLSNEGQQRSWDCAKVGLSIIDSLEDCSKFSGKILQASESKKTSLSPQMMTETSSCETYKDSVQASKSLPKEFCKVPYTQNGSVFPKAESNVLFEIGETLLELEPFGKTVASSLDSCSPIKHQCGLTASNFDSDSNNFSSNGWSSPPLFIGGSHNNTKPLVPAELNSKRVAATSSSEFAKSLSASEIENSEDYTCVISHGPNPKTTHIFCDCILETHANDFNRHHKKEEEGKGLSLFSVNSLDTTLSEYPSDDFLSSCYHCHKKLEEGKDIYIYRGEKSFCSLTCRAIEIMIDEELDGSNSSDPSSENSPNGQFGEKAFETAT